MTTLASASLSREHQEHRAHSLLVLVWVWPHSLAVICIVIVTLAAVLEPKIWLSHGRDRVTLWLQGLNTHSKALDTDRRLFFSLPYFGFRISVSVLSFQYFSVFHLPEVLGQALRHQKAVLSVTLNWDKKSTDFQASTRKLQIWSYYK